MNHIKQFPHCDSKVLHAPEDNCKYCNAQPEWQELRKYWGIAFTGHSGEVGSNGKPLIPCPSEWDRPVETINKWGGNVAMTPEREEQIDQYYEELRESLKDLRIDE